MDYQDIEIAKALLMRLGVQVPATAEEVRQAAYEALKEEDFLDAHCHRLGRHYRDFTDSDWRQVIEMSGLEKVLGNPGACTTCIQLGVITRERTLA